MKGLTANIIILLIAQNVVNISSQINKSESELVMVDTFEPVPVGLVDTLKPCPFCGERLVIHTDHHGEWIAHRLEPGPCIISTIQIFNKADAIMWNRRIKES
jgi:hypothetical protein